jgi:uncharacterized protein with GYD domain
MGVKESPKRAEAFKDMAKTFGATVKEIFWTQGRYDIVTLLRPQMSCRLRPLT